MIRRYQLSSLAEQDIAGIAEFIARDNLAAALHMVDRFTDCFELLVSNPRMGEQYHHPRGLLHRTSVGNYLVVYQVREEEVVVVRVLHGARQYEDLL